MSLRCWFGQHEPGGLVGRGKALHVRCTRCDRLSPGVVIDGPAPRPMQPKAPRSRIWWLRAVYVREA
jgi:hypothetical protein